MPPLRSGNGRHRRPRQAPALLVTAGVTGAGLAIPLLGATGAHAAGANTWDRVAECESGGLWSSEEDNGYYGGLQLTLETWKKYGGTEYAERPDLASRGQQITVAEKILAAEGPDAWPNCADDSGLTASGEKPDVDPDADSGADSGDSEADAPVPERPYTSPSASAPDDDEGRDSGDASDGSSADPSDEPSSGPSGDSSADPSGGSSTDPSDEPSSDSSDSGSDSSDGGLAGLPDHSLLPAPGENEDDPSSGNDDASGSASPSPSPSDTHSPGRGDGGNDGDSKDGPRPGTGKHRGSPAGHPSRDGRADGDGRGEGGGRGGAREHRVVHGESLSRIAAENDVRGGWSELYERNRDVVGSDPDLILPGQELRL